MDDFENERPRLYGIAYRMLGSAAEADDVLQEAFVRWSERRSIQVASPRAFLTTIVVRLCIDEQKSARARREKYVGQWLPEPIVARALEPVARPDARAELAESLSLAFLVLLESLSPLERAAFLLREVFDHPYDEVASVLETNEVACRKLVARAREHVDENRPRFEATEAKKNELLQAFLGACAAGDSEALRRVLANDVVAHSDGGGKVSAALRPVLGRERVIRFLLGLMKKRPPSLGVELVRVNGEPGVVTRSHDGYTTVLTLSVAGDAIAALWIVANPDKLARVSPP